MDLEVLRSQDLPFWGPPPDLGTPLQIWGPPPDMGRDPIWGGTPCGVWVHMETSLKAHMTPMDP